MPVAIAPTGLTGMQHADGEILAARAAEKFGMPFTLSTMSICSIEDIAAHTTAAVLVPALRDARPRLHRAPDRARARRAVLRADADARPADPRPAPQGPEERPVGAAQADAGEPRSTWRPSRAGAWACWARKRRSFGNIVGHVEGVDDLSSLSRWTARAVRSDAQLGRRRVGQEALGRQADPEGHPRRRGRAPRRRQRRRRADRLQPRRAPARRRAVVDQRAAGDRRRRRLAASRCGWTAASAPARTC